MVPNNSLLPPPLTWLKIVGFPYPDNVDLATKVEATVRKSGAVPATIGILNGIARIGFSQPELEHLASTAGQKTTIKVSRRDLPFVMGMVCSQPWEP